jgi:hypothetical protein
MLGLLKFIEETKKYVCIKKAKLSNDGTVYDFMLYLPNDESQVADSPLLVISEIKITRHYSEINEITQAEFELVEELLKKEKIEGYNLSYPSDSTPDKYPLTRAFPSHCLLCDREHTSENAYIVRNKKSFRFYCYHTNQEKWPRMRNPSLKLTIGKTALDQEKKLSNSTKLSWSRITDSNDCFIWGNLIRMCTSGEKFSHTKVYEAIQATITHIPKRTPIWILKHRDPEKGLHFKMKLKLKIAKFEVKIVKYGGKTVKLKSLIDQAIIRGLIIFDNYYFLPYPINIFRPDSVYFNLFLGFLAKLVMEINKEIMEPILWHVQNVICNGDERLNEYIWNWWVYLVQKLEKKPRTILVLKSALQQYGKNIITDFIGNKVLGSHLYFTTSDLEKILEQFNGAI